MKEVNRNYFTMEEQVMIQVLKNNKGSMFVAEIQRELIPFKISRRGTYVLSYNKIHRILNDLIKKAKWVHIQGFNPFINGLKVEHCEGCLYNYSEVRKYSIKMAPD